MTRTPSRKASVILRLAHDNVTGALSTLVRLLGTPPESCTVTMNHLHLHQHLDRMAHQIGTPCQPPSETTPMDRGTKPTLTRALRAPRAPSAHRAYSAVCIPPRPRGVSAPTPARRYTRRMSDPTCARMALLRVLESQRLTLELAATQPHCQHCGAPVRGWALVYGRRTLAFRCLGTHCAQAQTAIETRR